MEISIWISRFSAKSRNAVVTKSLNEKCEKREQLAKEKGEKDIGASSIVTLGEPPALAFKSMLVPT